MDEIQYRRPTPEEISSIANYMKNLEFGNETKEDKEQYKLFIMIIMIPLILFGIFTVIVEYYEIIVVEAIFIILVLLSFRKAALKDNKITELTNNGDYYIIDGIVKNPQYEILVDSGLIVHTADFESNDKAYWEEHAIYKVSEIDEKETESDTEFNGINQANRERALNFQYSEVEALLICYEPSDLEPRLILRDMLNN